MGSDIPNSEHNVYSCEQTVSSVVHVQSILANPNYLWRPALHTQILLGSLIRVAVI